jgi:ABC-type branched-subunit amino acid transport system substrate-binding protein
MDEMLAVVPLAKRDGVFVVAATHLSDAPDNFFSTWIDAEVEAQRIAQFMAERHRTIAILSSQQSWELEVSRHIKNHMKKSGGSIVAIEEPSFEAPEVRSEVLRTKMRRPDAIFISSYYLLPRYLKEIYAQGLRVPVYSIELDQAIISASPQSAAAGLTFIAPQTPKSDFILRFRKRWQASPDIPAASSYDSAQILFQHIEKAGGDRKRVAELYRNFSEHQGVSGMIRREGGKTIVDTAMYEVRSGVIQKKNLD